MKLYFVRHGRTLWNQEGRFQGASGDSPLLPESIETLKRLGQYLKEIPFDQIYSSDLPRAVKSAEIIQSQLHTPCSLEIVPNLREWQLGKLEGLKIATLEAIYPQQIQAFRSNLAQFDTRMFGAESLYSTTQRTIQFIKSLNPNHSYLSQLDVTYKTPDLMSHFLPPHEVSFTFCCSSIVFPR
ncbi:phosphoglycerate mutase [Streptococcus pneumoniae]|nr:phosphoglycerate mutase [Streptococcus pneumoniae]VOZ57144.1 phosphoglycerate mutase [Streptococcus pneumoniae]VPI65706.1 phosphoglycerate mutase [Streptococcus pneumoniae]VQF74225.1 phosphoglycerate mutase [Streptococcus pneumoniae]VQJ80663.1 phosphoglycerate mutase [Streptococcus pneumoniae]